MKKYTVEQLEEMVREVNGWNGSLEEYDYMEMDILNDYLADVEPLEVLRMAQYGDFNLNDDYFVINVYRNLESVSNIEHNEILENGYDEIVEAYEFELENGNVEPIE